MKNISIILALVLSCNSLRYCRQPFEDIHTSNITERLYNANKPIQDEFHASTLLGVWQCSYNTTVGDYTLCEIEFMSDALCDIVMEDIGVPNRHTRTFYWFLNNGFLNFDSGSIYTDRMSFSFKLNGYIYPVLTMEDGFGIYELRKIRPY